MACSGKSENLEALQIRLCWDIQKLSINPRRSSFVTNFTLRLSLNSFFVSDTPSRRQPHLGSSTCALLSTNLHTHPPHSLTPPAHLQCKVARPLRLTYVTRAIPLELQQPRERGRLDYYDNLSSLYAAPLFLPLSFSPTQSHYCTPTRYLASKILFAWARYQPKPVHPRNSIPSCSRDITSHLDHLSKSYGEPDH